MINYKETFKRPFQDLKKFIIGICILLIPTVLMLIISDIIFSLVMVIILIPITIITYSVFMGYVLICAKTSIKKNYKLPEWNNWSDLFIKGILSIVISLVYMIPAIIFFFLALRSIPSEIIYSTTLLTTPLGPGIAPLIIIGIMFLILYIYLIPLAIIKFSEYGIFSHAFDLKKIFKKAFKWKYLGIWFLIIIYTIVISLILSLIPFVGSPIANFITGITMVTAIGQYYSSKK